MHKQHKARYICLPGWVFLVAAVLVLLAGWNTGTNLFYVLFGGMAGFLVVSWMVSKWPLRSLEAFREGPASVYRGVRIPTALRIRNTSRFFPAPVLHVERLDGFDTPEAFIHQIPAQHEALLTIYERFERRGVYPLPPIELVTSFPFGLIERRLRVADGPEVVVYPRVHALRPSALELASQGGRLVRRRRGQGDEFYSMRQYIPGDDLRRIAWRASARANTLLVKELEQETSRDVACIFDNRQTADADSAEQYFEDAVELAASLAVTLLQRQYRVALITATSAAPLGEGPTQIARVLDMLARVMPAPDGSADPFAYACSQQHSAGLRLLAVSPNPGSWGRALAGAGVHVLDPREALYA